VALAIVVEKGGSGSQLAPIAADILTYYFHAEETLEAPPAEGILIR
jgi:penicillin-binding protein 2